MLESGATDLRINLSHSNFQSLEKYYNIIHDCGVLPSLDTQGAQIRISGYSDNLELYMGLSVIVCSESMHDKNYIKINHPELFSQIHTGDILKVDFEGLILSVVRVFDSYCECKVISEGNIALNKAIDVHNTNIKLSPFTKFDLEAIKAYVTKGISSIYISFANSADDIKKLKIFLDSLPESTLHQKPRIIAKIESQMGIYNLQSILKEVDGILVDRGDLSREISISRIPLATKSIISSCRQSNIPCYVATNVLDSMITNSLPSRAEISDLYNLLECKVSGIVLAAECAIGNHPVESVQVVNHISRVFNAHQSGTLDVLPNEIFRENLTEQLANWL